MAVSINSGTLFQAGGNQIVRKSGNSKSNTTKRKKAATVNSYKANIGKSTQKSSYKPSDVNGQLLDEPENVNDSLDFGKKGNTEANITTKNGIGISVNKANVGRGSTYLTEDDGVMLELSEDNGTEVGETDENSILSDKDSQKTKKEEEYEKFQKQLEALKDMLERTKEAQKNAKKIETKTKKVLNYSYKKVSSNIQSAKNVSQASNAVSSANSNLSALKRKAASGDYDDEELNIAISHAKRMIAVAKKKLAHIKQEVMNKKDDDKYVSSEKEKIVKIPDEKIRAEQQKELRRIEDEIEKEEKKEKQAHRGEENNKLLDADMTYLKAKIEIWKRGGGDFGIMMSQSQGAAMNMDMTQTLTDTSKLNTEQIELSAEQSADGQTEVAASINLSV
ncbi:hypothetical protein KQI69_00875 [Eubacterium sp. MSJ-13]|uniref:hypothetical protein n=1 Tax=Eubacterium sp. MSJ-13 TaxID=2841513 RepID=UPI001C122664|nr:hypothetical protein [Eubacterium sp. MSJ-13]MBU5477752.1 hypothetical protein [Eubacterium sp. MSJ-13]